MYERIKNRSEFNRDEILNFTSKLVQTASPSFDEVKAARLIKEKFVALGYDEVFCDDFGNVVGILYGRHPKSTVLLNCHMDTVNHIDTSEWDFDPFCGSVKDGKLLGLGATDCKGGLVAQMYAGAILKHSLLPLEGDLVVAATVAEDNGKSLGVKGLIENTLKEMNLIPTYAILGEPTELGLYYGHDGWCTFDITIEGADAFHVDDATRMIMEDFDLNGSAHKFSDNQENMDIMSPRFEDYSGSRRAVIPVSRRLRQEEKVDEVISQIRHNMKLVARNSGTVSVDVMVHQEEQKLYTGRTSLVKHITNAWATEPFHPLIERSRQALSAAGCEVRPGKWKLDRLGMGTAGSVLVKEFHIPTIGYGPGIEEVAHKPNEYVMTDKLVEAVYGTASIVHSLIGVPVFGWTSDEI